ncbi:MAG: M6 family metalloprotease domain-containing protein [Bacteroidota bacterium]
MKTKFIFLFVVLIINCLLAGAANFSFLPYTVKQPDGAVINCFASGDEYFNWLHDKDGYTIIQGDDGYYYWGIISGDIVVATTLRADETNPSQAGLAKWAKISLAKYNQRKAFYSENVDKSVRAPHIGVMNNLVVYIRFNDDIEFTTTRQDYDNKFNLPSGNALKSYFSEVSYTTFKISSTHYPECAMTTNLSYKDTHNRNYFQPYNAVTNPNGYTSDNDSRMREHTLLKDAITWINANSPIPADLNIDGDNDGRVDNVCFIVRGNNGAWADLLWAHRWALYSFNVFINGKRVYDYTFQPETQVDVNTLCHEMFHALGSPDLYHYTSNGITPVGPWDLMQSGIGHMGAYMKWKYTNNSWIDSIPEITASGTYSLHPLASSVNNCYKIASPYSLSQFFIVEYRRKLGTFEGSLPGSGLIVYRIDTTVHGNASGPPDEVYLYRPGGTLVVNGSINTAFFSAGSGRTIINETSNPTPFLQDGSPGGLDISNVTAADTTISFTVFVTYIDDPAHFSAAPISSSEIDLNWQKNPSNSNVVIAYNSTNSFGIPVNGSIYAPGDVIPGGGIVLYNGPDTTYNHTGLLTKTRYFYKAWSVLPGTSYSPGTVCNNITFCESVTTLPFSEGFENSSDRPDCWFEDGSDPVWQFFTGNGPGIGTGYPATAHSGIRNACLIDLSTTPDYNTLVTPVFNLSGYNDVRLKFWLFMQKWGTRQDELQIFYRVNPGSTWTLLQSFTTSFSTWTEQSVSLSSISNEFQLGFCGNAKSGFGVCIDDILVEGTMVGVSEHKSDNFYVSPNPSAGIFRVTSVNEDNQIREITIFDCTGKRMAGVWGNGEKEFNFDLSFAAPGIYILKIKTEMDVIIRKLTITR